MVADHMAVVLAEGHLPAGIAVTSSEKSFLSVRLGLNGKPAHVNLIRSIRTAYFIGRHYMSIAPRVYIEKWRPAPEEAGW